VDILLLGPQGSGKGTQARRIAAEYGVPHIATGDMIRAAISSRSGLGLQVKEIYERGDLVPDEIMIEVIRERLAEPDAREGFVLDGFPRNLAQAEALDELLREIGRELDVIFEFQTADESLLFERMKKRARDEGRTDDTPEAMRRRLDTYYAHTQPLVEYYRSRTGRLVGIHADRTVNEVFAEIQDALEQVAEAAA
jgi:adenylate kinase